MVFVGSTLGNANSHNNRNMPIILAGGGFKHGRHLAFNQEFNYPLAKLRFNAVTSGTGGRHLRQQHRYYGWA